MDESLEVTWVKVVIYTVLLTVVFLVFGLAVHELLHLQRFISLEVLLLLEGLTVICFGGGFLQKSPRYKWMQADKSRVFMRWVKVRQLSESPKGAIIFMCSGFIVLIIGLLLLL